MFITGDGNPKFSTQAVGELYLWEMPFLLPLGTMLLFKKREGYWWLIPIWLLIGIIPAATARETPHALRIESTLPTFQFLSTYAIVQIWLYLKEKKYKPIIRNSYSAVLTIIMIFNLIYYVHDYYTHYAKIYSGEWQYGYKDAISYANKVENQYDNILVEDSLGRPYIYYLFYQKIPPDEFRQTAIIKRDAFGFVSIEGFSKYKFPKMIKIDPNSKKNLYILYVHDNSLANMKPKKTFHLLDGSVILNAYAF